MQLTIVKTSASYIPPPSLTAMAFGDGTPIKAIYTALIVGTLLTIINHGDQLLAGAAVPVVKILLTYCVPYCVTTWGAITGKRSQWTRDKQAGYCPSQ